MGGFKVPTKNGHPPPTSVNLGNKLGNNTYSHPISPALHGLSTDEWSAYSCMYYQKMPNGYKTGTLR